jgi:glucosamine-phosphate N-acetyltransferase
MAEEKHIIRPISYIDYHNNYLELLQHSFTMVPSDVSIQSFTNFIGNLGVNHQIFVIEKEVVVESENDKKTIIVGSITVLIEQKLIHSMGKVAHIEDLITHNSYRGQHIASQLIEHAKEYSKQNACYKIILNCDTSLELFYERNGFTKKGTQMALYLHQ